MIKVKIPFSINGLCHNTCTEMLYDPINSLFFCSLCKQKLPLTKKQIICEWCDLLDSTIKSNKNANIKLLSNPTEESINFFYASNNIISEIQKELVLYLDDHQLRYDFFNSDIYDQEIEIAKYVDGVVSWFSVITQRIKKWAEELK